VYYSKNQPRDAIPLLASCVEAQPDNPLYRYHLGMAYAKAGMTTNALEQLKAAVATSAKFSGRDEAEQTIAALSASTDQK
jgi:predicted Zn-dependent protease